jgi:glutamate formiminotransferase
MCKDCENHHGHHHGKHKKKVVCETELYNKKVSECVKVPKRVTKTVWKKVTKYEPVKVSKIVYVDKKVKRHVPCERKVKRCVKESKHCEDLCPEI